MARPRRDGSPSRPTDRRRLNDLVVKRLKPAERPYLVWDSHQRGLAVSVQPSGHAAYKVIYSRAGKSHWLDVGNVRDVPLEKARLIAARTMLAVAEGKNPAAERRAERAQGTFDELATRYREEYARVKNKSWAQADQLVRRHLLPRWGKMKAADVSRDEVEKEIARIKAPILSNQVLASASAIFSWAVKKKVVTINPCIGIERHETRSRERVLTEEELPLFWNALDDVDPVRAAALRVILLCGQRPGEVCHMRSEHLAGSWWTMPGLPQAELGWPGTKNGNSHRIWLPKPAMALLPDFEAGFVFGRALYGIDATMREICAKIGIPRTTPHDLRRTHGSTVTGMGFGRPAMNRVQNHKEGGIADVYDRHDYSEEIKRVMEAVAARITGLISGDLGAANVLSFR
jgi:integrase